MVLCPVLGGVVASDGLFWCGVDPRYWVQNEMRCLSCSLMNFARCHNILDFWANGSLGDIVGSGFPPCDLGNSEF